MNVLILRNIFGSEIGEVTNVQDFGVERKKQAMTEQKV